MEQIMSTNPVSGAKVWNTSLNKIFVLASGVCLAGVFYLNGTFNTHLFSAPQPSNKPVVAGDAAANKATGTTGVSDIVTKALAFKALLTTSEQSTLELTYTTTLARKWSNLPCGATCRNGIQFGALTTAQLQAALDLIKAATGTTANNGYDEFLQNRLAEAYLHANGGGSGYDSTLRWIAFLNTPTATGAWMLQFGGHHYAANISFNNGHMIGGTPFFQGLEPLSFTMNGTTYAPMTDEHDAFTAMLASLSSTQLASAKLTSTFSDCVMVPGETNGGTSSFPAKAGLICSGLTTAQKNLVIAAIKNYVDDLDSTTAAAIMAVYTSEIDQTYIAYTGSGTTGTASSFLNANSNYVRIDGPTVWVELACQNGVIFPTQIHYHTVWRDHSHDYGVDLTGSAIDVTTTAVTEVKVQNQLKLYPNPATSQVSVNLTTAVNDATVTLVSAATGKVVTQATHSKGSSFQYDVSSLPAGVYILKIEDASNVYTGKFNKI